MEFWVSPVVQSGSPVHRLYTACLQAKTTVLSECIRWMKGLAGNGTGMMEWSTEWTMEWNIYRRCVSVPTGLTGTVELKKRHLISHQVLAFFPLRQTQKSR